MRRPQRNDMQMQMQMQARDFPSASDGEQSARRLVTGGRSTSKQDLVYPGRTDSLTVVRGIYDDAAQDEMAISVNAASLSEEDPADRQVEMEGEGLNRKPRHVRNRDKLTRKTAASGLTGHDSLMYEQPDDGRKREKNHLLHIVQSAEIPTEGKLVRTGDTASVRTEIQPDGMPVLEQSQRTPGFTELPQEWVEEMLILLEEREREADSLKDQLLKVKMEKELSVRKEQGKKEEEQKRGLTRLQLLQSVWRNQKNILAGVEAMLAVHKRLQDQQDTLLEKQRILQGLLLDEEMQERPCTFCGSRNQQMHAALAGVQMKEEPADDTLEFVHSFL